MTGFTSIRFRLTAWYTLCLAGILAVFGFGTRWAIQTSLMQAIDHDLRSRLEDVRAFLKQQTVHGQAELLDELGEQAMLGLGGGLVELRNGDGAILYRSPRLDPSFPTRGRKALRTVSDIVSVNGGNYQVRVAAWWCASG